MNICVVSEGYPTKEIPAYTFVEQLCNAIAMQKHTVSVVALRWLTDYLFRKRKIPYFRDSIIGDNVIRIFSPMVTSFGKGKSLSSLSEKLCSYKVCRSLDKLDVKPNVIYGHFWSNAYLAYPYAKKYNIPLFVATGESVITFDANTKDKKEFCNYVSGVICVSTKNKNESIAKGLTKEHKCKVFPNAVNDSIFHIIDKKQCRRKLGITENDFVVSYVGRFSNRKGPNRVADAIRHLNDRTIKSIFIGTGHDSFSESLNCDGIIFKGELSHELIPEYLNASDVFVLPTLHEGCCNAIIEAMACGLPVISSNREFNVDVLDATNSILVEPLNIVEIADAIKKLKNDRKHLLKMGEASSLKAESLRIEQRADNILQFIRERIQ